MTAPTAKYRAAIIGCGRIASDFDDDPLMVKNYGISTHAGAYTADPGTVLVAAADISPEKLRKFGQRWGVAKLYADYRELLKQEQVDILSICTWNTTHLEILEEAARRKVKAVFCEKPLSHSLESADRMVRIAREHGIPLMVNHRRRWDDVYVRIRDYIRQGGLGDIQQVSCYYTSGVANTCSHLFDTLRMLFGDITTVTAWYKGDAGKDDPDMDGYLVFARGGTATVQALDARHYSLFEFDIYGTRGRLRIEDNGFKTRFWELKEGAQIPGHKALVVEESPIPVVPKTIMKDAVRNIVQCLASGAVPAGTGDDGVQSLEIICAFHASAGNGNMPVRLPLTQRTMHINSK